MGDELVNMFLTRWIGLEDTRGVLTNSWQNNVNFFLWLNICDLTDDCLSFVSRENRLKGPFISAFSSDVGEGPIFS